MISYTPGIRSISPRPLVSVGTTLRVTSWGRNDGVVLGRRHVDLPRLYVSVGIALRDTSWGRNDGVVLGRCYVDFLRPCLRIWIDVINSRPTPLPESTHIHVHETSVSQLFQLHPFILIWFHVVLIYLYKYCLTLKVLHKFPS